MNIQGTISYVHKQGVAAVAAATGLALLASGCAPSYPPIARTGGDASFKYRIATHYPPGSRGERLRLELEREGFKIAVDPTGRRFTATDRPPNLPCFSGTRIDWNEDRRGRITIIQAARHSCT